MSHEALVEIVGPNDWSRVREIHLKSLIESPHAFGATFETASEVTENEWRERFTKLDYVIASINGADVAIMSIEELEGDFGATCWIGGCWSDPLHRGKGIFRTMFEFIDVQNRDWKIQGLGVWIDNYSAIAAYEKLGFVRMGEDTPSTRQPGKFHQRMIRKSPV